MVPYLEMSQTRQRVLVVDDDLATAQTLGRVLATSEFAVEIFTDAKEALGTFKGA